MKTIPSILVAAVIIALFMAGVLSSCSVTKKAVSKSKTELQDQTQVDTQKESTAVSEKTTKDSMIVNITENHSGTFTKIERDMDKPVDPVTGLHPEKSRTTGEFNMNKETKAEKGSDSEIKDSTAVSERDSSKLDIKTKERIETELIKKSGSRWWFWVLLGAIVVGVLIILYRKITNQLHLRI